MKLLQVFGLKSMQGGESTEATNQLALSALEMINKELNVLDNRVVMEGGSMSAWDRKELDAEIDKYRRTKLDVIFTLFNIQRMDGNYAKALEYAKERTQVTLELSKIRDVKWAFAIMLEAQCMTKVETVDPNETIKVLNRGLEALIKLNKGG